MKRQSIIIKINPLTIYALHNQLTLNTLKGRYKGNAIYKVLKRSLIHLCQLILVVERPLIDHLSLPFALCPLLIARNP